MITNKKVFIVDHFPKFMTNHNPIVVEEIPHEKMIFSALLAEAYNETHESGFDYIEMKESFIYGLVYVSGTKNGNKKELFTVGRSVKSYDNLLDSIWRLKNYSNFFVRPWGDTSRDDLIYATERLQSSLSTGRIKHTKDREEVNWYVAGVWRKNATDILCEVPGAPFQLVDLGGIVAKTYAEHHEVEFSHAMSDWAPKLTAHYQFFLVRLGNVNKKIFKTFRDYETGHAPWKIFKTYEQKPLGLEKRLRNGAFTMAISSEMPDLYPPENLIPLVPLIEQRCRDHARTMRNIFSSVYRGMKFGGSWRGSEGHYKL